MIIETGNIVWLASYPKSGNTWFRIFLTNLFADNSEPADINQITSSSIASSISLFEDSTGINASELSQNEIDLLRPQVYNYISENTNKPFYQKIHDAWRLLPNGEPLIPKKATKAVIYFIRNPLDIAISFAHHSSNPINKTIKSMSHNNFALCQKDDRFFNQLRQVLFSWSSHVISWVNKSELPVLVLRYEDMLENPFESFAKAIKFVGLKYKENQINKAIEFSSFNILKKQEQEKGFKEKNQKATSFFRKGIKDDWKNILTNNQVKEIIKNHYAVMKTYGYVQ